MLKIHLAPTKETAIGIIVVVLVCVLGVITLVSVGVSLTTAYKVQNIKKSASTIDEATLSKAVTLLEELEKEN
jgi:hypothetical protein